MAKKTTKKRTPTSGQSGPVLELSLEDLNPKERRVLMAINGAGSGKRPEMGIVDLAEACWKSKSKFASNSWTRNSLRRLVRGGMIDKLARGSYRIAEGARKALAKSVEDQKSGSDDKAA